MTIQLIATASLTGAELYRDHDGTFFVQCRCGKRLPNAATEFDAQAAFREHWTAKPYC